MKKTMFVATVVDYGESVDGKARVLGIFNTKDEAKQYVKNDMNTWVEQNKDEDEDINVDYDKMSAYFDFDTDGGCEWNIEEVNIS